MEGSPFGVVVEERVAVFVDGPNNYAACKHAGVDMDYLALAEHFEENSTFLRPYFYTSVETIDGVTKMKPFLDKLEFNGFTVSTKPIKESIDESGRLRERGGMEVEMVLDMVELSFSSNVNHMVVFSGNGALAPALALVKRRGIRVTIVSTASTISDELRRVADKIVDLDADEIRSEFKRSPR